jgi:hypothetical protein
MLTDFFRLLFHELRARDLLGIVLAIAGGAATWILGGQGPACLAGAAAALICYPIFHLTKGPIVPKIAALLVLFSVTAGTGWVAETNAELGRLKSLVDEKEAEKSREANYARLDAKVSDLLASREANDPSLGVQVRALYDTACAIVSSQSGPLALRNFKKFVGRDWVGADSLRQVSFLSDGLNDFLAHETGTPRVWGHAPPTTPPASSGPSIARQRMIRESAKRFIAEGMAVDSFSVMGYQVVDHQGNPWTPAYWLRMKRISDWEKKVLAWTISQQLDRQQAQWETMMDTSSYATPGDTANPGNAHEPIMSRVRLLQEWRTAPE